MTDLYWKGRNVHDMTRDELIVALKEMHELYMDEIDMHHLTRKKFLGQNNKDR